MKVKVGDKIFDDRDEAIMVILSETDKENITNMHPEATKYCSFPDHFSDEDVEKWMKDKSTFPK